MALGTRGVPRFLPTLTEVVQPGVPMPPADPVHAPLPAAAAEPEARPATAPVDDAVAMQHALALEGRLREQLEQRVRQIVEGALAAQVARITSQVMGELEPTVRQLARENGLRGATRFDAD